LQAIVDAARVFIDQIRRNVGDLDAGGEAGVGEVLARQCVTVAAFLQELQQSARSQRAAAEELQRTAKAVVAAAHSVSGVALTSKVLCMNTMIEAGRLGNAGLPMVVIADQMRTLSERVGRTNKEISASMNTLLPILEQVDQGSQRLEQRARDFSQEFDRQREDVAAVAGRVQTTARGTLDAADGKLAVIVEHSHRALVQLQTQDIVSQRLQRAAQLVGHRLPATSNSANEPLRSPASSTSPSTAAGSTAMELAPGLLSAMAAAPVATTYLSETLPGSDQRELAAGEMELF
jgi:methyl-accepting chemotaxis protein